MECTIIKEYRINVDYIIDGLQYEWSILEGDATLAEGKFDYKCKVKTVGDTTVTFTLQCKVTAPDGRLSVLTKEITHERVKFNPTVADPFGKGRKAFLYTLNGNLHITKTPDIAELPSKPLIPTNGYEEEQFTSYYECKYNKFGYKIDDEKQVAAYNYPQFFPGNTSIYNSNNILVSFIIILLEDTTGKGWVPISRAYYNDSGDLTGNFTSILNTTFAIEDNILYSGFRASSENISTVTQTAQSSKTTYSSTKVDYLPITDTPLEVNTPYQITAFYPYDYGGTYSYSLYYFVNGNGTNTVTITKNNTNQIQFGQNVSTSYSFICVGTDSAGYNWKDNINGKFVIKNFRVMYSNSDEIQKSEAEIMGLEIANCQIL